MIYIKETTMPWEGNTSETTWVEYKEFDDLSQTMHPFQFIQRGKKSDAERVIQVLGTANASFEPVEWKRKEDQLKPYVDFIISIGCS